MAFQEAYKTQVLAKIQEMQDAKQNEPPSADEVNVKDEDVQALVGCSAHQTMQKLPRSVSEHTNASGTTLLHS